MTSENDALRNIRDITHVLYRDNYCPTCGAKLVRLRASTVDRWSSLYGEFFDSPRYNIMLGDVDYAYNHFICGGCKKVVFINELEEIIEIQKRYE